MMILLIFISNLVRVEILGFVLIHGIILRGVICIYLLVLTSHTMMSCDHLRCLHNLLILYLRIRAIFILILRFIFSLSRSACLRHLRILLVGSLFDQSLRILYFQALQY